MKLKINLGVLIVFFLILGISDRVLAKDDWEYWPAINVKKALNEKMDLKVSFAGRFKDDMDKFYFGGAQLGSAFKVNEYFSVTPSYFFIKYEDSGHFEEEHRYMLDAAFSWKMKKMKLSHRSRFEYRDLPALDRWRYRARLKAGLPVKVHNRSLTPYVSEEIFYDERKGEFNQNRFSLGSVIKINKAVSVDVYYLLRSDKKGEDWSERNALGTSLNLSF